jgi:hypothetical protein
LDSSPPARTPTALSSRAYIDDETCEIVKTDPPLAFRDAVVVEWSGEVEWTPGKHTLTAAFKDAGAPFPYAAGITCATNMPEGGMVEAKVRKQCVGAIAMMPVPEAGRILKDWLLSTDDPQWKEMLKAELSQYEGRMERLRKEQEAARSADP